MNSSSDEEYFDCNSEPIKYYAVACQKNKGSGLVTTDINEAKKKVKSIKGSRFNSFYSALEAQRFSETYLLDDLETTKNKLPKPDADPFPNVSAIDLNHFKDAIEKSDTVKCHTLISNNPRYLVTASDFPPLLRASRFHYNALHVATTANQPVMVQLILDYLSNESFWRSLHPTADDRCNDNRRDRVVDMYLNTPDFWNSETPLHFAAKFGFGDCVRALLSHEMTDTTMRNKQGRRADEIICSRYDGPDKEAKINEISEIFSEKYVVLMVNGDRMEIMEPVSHCQLQRMLRVSSDEHSRHNSLAGGHIRAYIGPLPDTAARQLRYRWSVLNAEDAIKFDEIRRKDAEKGLECHGRYLARLFGAPWKEYWPFLNCYTDLGDEEGLAKLEEHLSACDRNGSVVSVTSDGDGASSPSGVRETSESRLHRMYSSLARLFGRMTLRSVGDASPSSLMRVDHGSVAPVASGNHARVEPSLLRSQTRFNTSVLGRGVLTPTDRQVRQALLAPNGGTRHQHYPHISSWLDDLSFVDPIHDQHASPSIHDAVTSTPLKHRPTRTTNCHTVPPSPCFVTPLSKIQLSD